MHVLNGEKYKELCPDNTLLSTGQIKNCIILHHQKALLKREGMSDDQLRVMLPLEVGRRAYGWGAGGGGGWVGSPT